MNSDGFSPASPVASLADARRKRDERESVDPTAPQRLDRMDTEEMTDSELIARLDAVRAQNDAKFAECIASNSALGADIRTGFQVMGGRVDAAQNEMKGEFIKIVAVLDRLSQESAEKPSKAGMWVSNFVIGIGSIGFILAVLSFAADRFDGGMSASGFQTQSAINAERISAHDKEHNEPKKSPSEPEG